MKIKLETLSWDVETNSVCFLLEDGAKVKIHPFSSTYRAVEPTPTEEECSLGYPINCPCEKCCNSKAPKEKEPVYLGYMVKCSFCKESYCYCPNRLPDGSIAHESKKIEVPKQIGFTPFIERIDDSRDIRNKINQVLDYLALTKGK